VIRRVVSFIAGFSVIATLVLASCSPASTSSSKTAAPTTSRAPTTSAAPTSGPPSQTTTPAQPAKPAATTPQYGGTFTFIFGEPMGFDPKYTIEVNCNADSLVTNEMLEGDWSKGQMGTGETDWMLGWLGRIGIEKGSLAESWDLPDTETIIFHLRKGVRFWNKPPVNGRELNADDVVFSMKRSWESPAAWNYTTWAPENRPKSITALDKYTVQIKGNPAVQGTLFFQIAEQTHIFAKEIDDFRDWRNMVSTGPFMVTDYVPGSSLTYTRNPGYFETDPFFPKNQLPYVDSCKQLIITDQSTAQAALRTGKIDTTLGATSLSLNWEDMNMFKRQCPDLKLKQVNGASIILWGRMDKPELPFKDIRVRQAMNLAVNKQEIVDKYYGGNAQLLGVLFPPLPAWKDVYTPLDQLPSKPSTTGSLAGSQCSVQELFSYNPDKAKKLLADAGYPNGFKTKIVCGSSQDADYLAMIKAYFAKVGIDMDIQQLETGVFTSMSRGRTHEQMIIGTAVSTMSILLMVEARIEHSDDKSFCNFPESRVAYNELNKYVARDDAAWQKVRKEDNKFFLETAAGVWMPLGYGYRMWWPWLKNYNGEGTLGYDNAMAVSWYIWIDQNLKRAMGY
jgi:peptide/nickel transport system substrate-binding protein